MSEASSPDAEARVDATRGRYVVEETLRALSAGEKLDPEVWSDFVRVQNQSFTTGPDIGERAPAFDLPDQSGRRRTLADLSGPEGLLLAFVRSADW